MSQNTLVQMSRGEPVAAASSPEPVPDSDGVISSSKPDDDVKQVIAVRQDIKMGKGKTAAHVAHACLKAGLFAHDFRPDVFGEWMNGLAKKIVVKVDDEGAILKLQSAAHKANLTCHVMMDAGLTQLEPGTITCIAIGPEKASKIDTVTSKLKLL